MKKTAAFGIVLLVVTVLGVSYYVRQPDEPRQSEVKVSVRMKWFFAGTMTGWFGGREQGIFKTQGIDLAINPGGPNNSSIKLVAAGSDLFGVAGADEVLLARAKGIPIVAVGVLFKESPVCFISKKSSGLRAPSDWSGKTVEVSYGSNAETEYRALIAKVRPSNLKEVPYTFNLIPFVEDKVDVSVAYCMDQVITLERRGIELLIVRPKDYGINPYGDVVITTEKTLQDHPDLVRRFMVAVVTSHAWAIEHPDAAVASLVASASSLTAANELAVWKATIPFLVPDGVISSIGLMQLERWKDTLDVMLVSKALSEPVALAAAYRSILK